MNIVIKATTWTIGWSWMTLSRSHGWSMAEVMVELSMWVSPNTCY